MVDEYVRYVEELVEKLGPEMGPFFYEWFHFWRRRRLKSLPAPYALLAPPFALGLGGASVPPVSDLLGDLESYAQPSERVVIDRIRISSPGGISFSGLGDVIREIRELVKDLWFRNKQERALGELDIIEKYLGIRERAAESDLVLPPLPSGHRPVAKQILEGINGWRRLEGDGKLEHVGEHIDERPDE
jgi:hypothetical protein